MLQEKMFGWYRLLISKHYHAIYYTNLTAYMHIVSIYINTN